MWEPLPAPAAKPQTKRQEQPVASAVTANDHMAFRPDWMPFAGRCWVCVRCFINSRPVIRTVRFRVSPDKKILRHLHDSKHQDDDADNHRERDEDMHKGHIASRPLTDNTRIQVNADGSG
jgi:hypothetical protein